MAAHEFEDGTIVSEMVIDIELKRNKGRVSREEALDLARVANEIRKKRDHYESELEVIAQQIHYPECWDTTAYPTLLDALKEFTCNPECCEEEE